jgi:predicted nucleotidyltransferase
MTSMQLDELVAQRRSEILAIAAQYGASDIRLFGSVARHEADEMSDIDFLVELKPDRSLFDLGGLVTELTELLGRPVDVVTAGGLKDRIRDRVIAEAVPV